MEIAINGFGRIGRNFLRTIFTDQIALKKIHVAAINIGPANPDFVSHMFKYDTLMGTFNGAVSMRDGYLIINDHKIKIIAQTDIAKIDWRTLNIDWVVESSGLFTKREAAARHMSSGARYVLITAPATDEDITIIPGINDQVFDSKKHHIVSLGSCSTNALAPMLKVIHAACGIQSAFMTSIHAYTNSQALIDVEKKTLRRSRAAALNIIPTTSGATKTVGKVMPELADRINGCAVRVPIAVVSLIDLVFVAEKKISIKAINQAFEQAKEQAQMKGIVGITHEPLVSSDFAGMHESVILDGLMTSVQGNMGKVFGWYDNEWGYSMRLKDFLIGQQ